MFYCLFINLSNNQTNEKDLTYKVRVSYRMYPYLFHTTSRESKNVFLEQGIQSFSGHARTDTRVTYKEKRDTLIQNDHTLLIAGQFVENDTLFFVQEYDCEAGKMSRNTYIFLEPDRQSEYFQPDYWINRFEGNHEDYLQQIKEYRNYHLKNNGTPYQK